MPITTPCYCTREDVKTATDMQSTAYNNVQIDRAIQESARSIDGRLHRQFYPNDTTKYFDWPPQGGQGGGQIAYPWRLWFDQNDCVAITDIQSPPGTSLSLAFFNLEPANYGPPYTYIEVQRDKKVAFSSGPTPQRSIAITGTWGHTLTQDSAGTLGASISSVSATTCTVSNESLVGVGDLLTIDSERILVQDKNPVTTTFVQQGAGAGTTSAADNILAVSNASTFNTGEVLLLDSEKMLVLTISANNLTVARAYDGTFLGTHSSATIFSFRSLTVLRGQLGTTAATHSNGATVTKLHVPSLIRGLALGEALAGIQQETGAYANPQGAAPGQVKGLGSGLANKWDQAYARYGRKVRYRGV